MKRVFVAVAILAALAVLAAIAVFLMTREEATPVEDGYGANATAPKPYATPILAINIAPTNR